MKIIMDPDSSVADPACMVLSNLTRPPGNIERVIELIIKCGFTLDEVVSVFTKRQHNQKGANLDYLGPVLSNLSQSVTFRRWVVQLEAALVLHYRMVDNDVAVCRVWPHHSIVVPLFFDKCLGL